MVYLSLQKHTLSQIIDTIFQLNSLWEKITIMFSRKLIFYINLKTFLKKVMSKVDESKEIYENDIVSAYCSLIFLINMTKHYCWITIKCRLLMQGSN